jgi:hypothetical protein
MLVTESLRLAIYQLTGILQSVHSQEAVKFVLLEDELDILPKATKNTGQ